MKQNMKGLSWVVLAALLCACHGSSSNSGPSVTHTYNLEPLSSFPGVSDWGMSGGGPSHSGYVPVTLDAADFSARWSVVLPKGNPNLCNQDGGGYSCVLLLQPVTDSADGRVIVLTDLVVGTAIVNGNNLTLFSINETDGSIAWSNTDFPLSSLQEDDDEFSTPSYADGKVYMSYFVDSQNSPQVPVLEAFDAKSGTKAFSVNPPCTSPCINFAYEATDSVIAGSVLYAGAPLSAYDAGNGNLLWTAAGGSLPAVDSQAVYYSEGETHDPGPAFVALDTSSGSQLFQISGKGQLGNLIPPVLDGMDGALVGRFGVALSRINPASGYLDHYSLVTHTLDWAVSGGFSYLSQIVTAKGAAYTCSNTQVVAYDLSDGTLLWSWTPPGDTSLKDDGTQQNNCSLVVTDNLLFVSSAQATYALDLSSHAVTWTWPEGGKLALSPSGLLYISVDTPAPSHLVAINLH